MDVKAQYQTHAAIITDQWPSVVIFLDPRPANEVIKSENEAYGIGLAQ